MARSWLRVSVALAVLALPSLSFAKETGKDAGKSTKESAAKEAPPAKPLTEDTVNGAEFAPPVPSDGKAKPDKPEKASAKEKTPDALTIKAQVLLDRAHFSPGAIDGLEGDNYHRAIAAFAAARKLPATDHLTKEVWDALQSGDKEPVVKSYTITREDADGPYTRSIPRKMEEQADLDAMGYTNAREMLAERFHMSRDLLSALNAGKSFDEAGGTITVAAVEPMGTDKPKGKDLPQDPKVERIDVDKTTRDVRAFGADG